jgi:hypothetical protein
MQDGADRPQLPDGRVLEDGAAIVEYEWTVDAVGVRKDATHHDEQRRKPGRPLMSRGMRAPRTAGWAHRHAAGPVATNTGLTPSKKGRPTPFRAASADKLRSRTAR